VTADRPLTQAEQNAINVVVIATGALAALGFVNSFARVAEAVEPTFGRLAWTVPLGIDLGIFVFALLGIVLARLDMALRWLRLVPWALTAATIYLNVADETSLLGRVAHAALPGLWIVAATVAEHAVSRRAGLATGRRMDRIRGSRWLLAPLATATLWRRMVLWEITSYRDGLNRERVRVLARADLQERYGKRWQKHATPRERALYRLGELAPVPCPGQQQEISPDPLLTTALVLVTADPDIGRPQLINQLRAMGHRIGSDRAAGLLRAARTAALNGHGGNRDPHERKELSS